MREAQQSRKGGTHSSPSSEYLLAPFFSIPGTGARVSLCKRRLFSLQECSMIAENDSSQTLSRGHHARTSFSKVSTRLAFPKSRFQKRRQEAQNFGGLWTFGSRRSLCIRETLYIYVIYRGSCIAHDVAVMSASLLLEDERDPGHLSRLHRIQNHMRKEMVLRKP